jgi:hypothetical protein
VLVSGDISEAAHCRAMINRAVTEFGRIDILVNNAAFQRTYESLDEISEEDWITPSGLTSRQCSTTECSARACGNGVAADHIPG